MIGKRKMNQKHVVSKVFFFDPWPYVVISLFTKSADVCKVTPCSTQSCDECEDGRWSSWGHLAKSGKKRGAGVVGGSWWVEVGRASVKFLSVWFQSFCLNGC